ncbi:MAG: hypothetical protein AB1679_16660 [Actinomycetota bacterium]
MITVAAVTRMGVVTATGTATTIRCGAMGFGTIMGAVSIVHRRGGSPGNEGVGDVAVAGVPAVLGHGGA